MCLSLVFTFNFCCTPLKTFSWNEENKEQPFSDTCFLHLVIIPLSLVSSDLQTQGPTEPVSSSPDARSRQSFRQQVISGWSAATPATNHHPVSDSPATDLRAGPASSPGLQEQPPQLFEGIASRAGIRRHRRSATQPPARPAACLPFTKSPPATAPRAGARRSRSGDALTCVLIRSEAVEVSAVPPAGCRRPWNTRARLLSVGGEGAEPGSAGAE